MYLEKEYSTNSLIFSRPCKMKLCKNYIQIKIWHHVIINWQEKKQFSILIKVSDYHDVRSDHLRSAMTHASETFYANDKGPLLRWQLRNSSILKILILNKCKNVNCASRTTEIITFNMIGFWKTRFLTWGITVPRKAQNLFCKAKSFAVRNYSKTVRLHVDFSQVSYYRSMKKVFLKISQYSLKNTCVGVS